MQANDAIAERNALESFLDVAFASSERGEGPSLEDLRTVEVLRDVYEATGGEISPSLKDGMTAAAAFNLFRTVIVNPAHLRFADHVAESLSPSLTLPDLQEDSLIALAKTVLFACIDGPRKQEFVSHIIGLQVSSQEVIQKIITSVADRDSDDGRYQGTVSLRTRSGSEGYGTEEEEVGGLPVETPQYDGRGTSRASGLLEDTSIEHPAQEPTVTMVRVPPVNLGGLKRLQSLGSPDGFTTGGDQSLDTGSRNRNKTSWSDAEYEDSLKGTGNLRQITSMRGLSVEGEGDAVMDGLGSHVAEGRFGKPTLQQRLRALKRDLDVALAAKEEVQLQLEQAKASLELQKAKNKELEEETKTAFSEKQKQLFRHIDDCEAELTKERSEKEKLDRLVKEQEKAHLRELESLQDELQDLTEAASKVPRLEQQVEKLKSKLDEMNAMAKQYSELQGQLSLQSKAAAEVQAAKQELSSLRSQLASCKENCAALTEELEKVTKAREDESRLYRSTIQQLERRCEGYEKALEGLREGEVAETRALQESLPTAFNVEGVEAKLEVQRLEREVAGLRKQLAEARIQRRPGEGSLSSESEEASASTSEIGTLKILVQSLQSQLEQAKEKERLQLQAMRGKWEEEHETIITTFKDQLQIRDKEVNLLQIAREEREEVIAREMRYMSAAFHALGAKLRTEQMEKESIKNEYEAFLRSIKEKKRQS